MYKPERKVQPLPIIFLCIKEPSRKGCPLNLVPGSLCIFCCPICAHIQQQSSFPMHTAACCASPACTYPWQGSVWIHVWTSSPPKILPQGVVLFWTPFRCAVPQRRAVNCSSVTSSFVSQRQCPPRENFGQPHGKGFKGNKNRGSAVVAHKTLSARQSIPEKLVMVACLIYLILGVLPMLYIVQTDSTEYTITQLIHQVGNFFCLQALTGT